MAIEVVVDFIRPETVRIRAEVKDDNKELTDAATAVCTVTDPNGTEQVSAQAMTKVSTGTYEYSYTLSMSDLIGQWDILIKTTDSSGNVSIEEKKFNVVR